jgi:hypothetical protein
MGGNTWSQAQFNGPVACALDTQSNLWVADFTNADIEEISDAGNTAASATTQFYVQTSVTNKGKVTYTTNFHAFPAVNGIAVDAADSVYILMAQNGTLIKYDQFRNPLSAVLFTNASFVPRASAMCLDGNSNVFLAFTNGMIIRFRLIDGFPPPVYINDLVLGGPLPVDYVVSSFAWQPAGLALLPDGQLAVSDTLNDAIYVVSTNDNSVPKLLTGGNGAGWRDGTPDFTQFNSPHGLAASADGRLVVCDTFNNRLRVIDTSTNTTTLYGSSSNIWTGTCCDPDVCGGSHAVYAGWVDGFAGNELYNTNAAGRLPVSVTIAPSGTLFVTELYYDLIRTVADSGLTPVNLSASLPVVITLPATSVITNAATLNASVIAGGEPSAIYFEWGTTIGYGNYSATNFLVTSLTNAQTISITLSNVLLAGTTYHFQAVATNSLGTGYGGDLTFTTPGLASSVTTLPASNITATTATISASIDANGLVTEVNSQWGSSSTNLGNITPTIDVTNNLNTNQVVSWILTNLVPDTTYYYQAFAYNSAGTANGSVLVFTTATVPPAVVTFSPSSGYFPECVTISVTSTVPDVFYTTDGSSPTTNSAQVTLVLSSNGLYLGNFQWCNSQEDLSFLRIAGFEGGISGIVLQGTAPTTNSIGFVRSIVTGTGAHAYVPIVVSLETGGVLKSLQFDVEVIPNDANTPPIQSLTLLPITADDFVSVVGPAPGDAPVTLETFAYDVNDDTISNGVGLAIEAAGNDSGLDLLGFGVVALLDIPIPTNAAYGQSYSLNVLNPSGTSDGQDAEVGLIPTPTQILTITDPPYLVGDSAPPTGYNASEFGNGLLDSSDVNDAIYASLGIRVPPSDSDAFNSMDAWPPDSAGRGGDGKIGLLDWETILGRSLGGVPIFPGLDTNNYIRFWTNGDNGYPSHQVVDWYPGGPPVKLSDTPVLPGLVWFCQACVGSGAVTGAVPGQTYSLPVYVNVLPGYSLMALQFRAIVTPNGDAPAGGQIQFNAAGEAPVKIVPGLSSNDIGCIWAGPISPPLQGSNYLGTITFQVPPSAPFIGSYSLHFSFLDGVPNGSTDYQLESFPGTVWLTSTTPQPPSLTSDQWKIQFFGSITNSLAADDVDADGDGASNWQEYIAGTNPTNALSCLQFNSATFVNNGVPGFGLGWLTAPGKTYILDASSSLEGTHWAAINTNTGDGNNYQFIVTNYSGPSRFYHIQVLP